MLRVRILLAMTMSLCAAVTASAAFEKVPFEVAKALKVTKTRVDTGLVFIDGKYLKPPYRVSRYGNQILINDRPVTGQIVPWEEFLKTQPPSNLKTEEVEVKEAPVAPAAKKPTPAASEKDGDDPAAPKDGGNAPPPASEDKEEEGDEACVRTAIVTTRYAADADDLEDFKPAEEGTMKLTDIPEDTAEDKARQKRAEEEKKEEAEEESKSEDEGEATAAATDANGDEVDPASPEGEAAAKAAAEKARPAVKTKKVTSLAGDFEENARSRKLMKYVDGVCAKVVTTLRRGGYVCFGSGTNGGPKYRVGLMSDATQTGLLLKKLPELMRGSTDSESFCDSVRSAGLMSYITLQVAQDLYRNRTDFHALQQHRRELAEAEKLKKMMNGNGR